MENIRKANDELRAKIDKLSADNEELQKVIDENDILVEDELKASIKSLDEILENMENDNSVNDSLKALEEEIASLEKTIGEKEDKRSKEESKKKILIMINNKVVKTKKNT